LSIFRTEPLKIPSYFFEVSEEQYQDVKDEELRLRLQIDFVDVVELGGANAVCAASIFFWVGESIITIKEYMHNKGLKVRLL